MGFGRICRWSATTPSLESWLIKIWGPVIPVSATDKPRPVRRRCSQIQVVSKYSTQLCVCCQSPELLRSVWIAASAENQWQTRHQSHHHWIKAFQSAALLPGLLLNAETASCSVQETQLKPSWQTTCSTNTWLMVVLKCMVTLWACPHARVHLAQLQDWTSGNEFVIVSLFVFFFFFIYISNLGFHHGARWTRKCIEHAVLRVDGDVDRCMCIH